VVVKLKGLDKGHVPSMATILYYSERGGPMNRISPWTKLLGLFLFVVMVTIMQSILLLLVVYALSLLLYVVGKFPLRKLLGWSLFPVFFILTISILFIFTQPGRPVIAFPGVFAITDMGLLLVVKLLLRGLAVVNYSLTFIMSTRYNEISVLADRILPSPFDVIFLLTYRFVFVVFEVLETALLAAWARGGSLRRGITSASSLYAKIFAVGVVYSFDKAERIGKAMEARGFSGELRSYGKLRNPSALEWAILVISIILIVLAYLYQGVIP
jgi:cobalt/nickel transport system permease protein